MSWGRLDDQAHEDERFWLLPMASVGIYYACLSRCLWRDQNHVSPAATQQATHLSQEAPLVEPLVDAGLWERVEGGFAYAATDWEKFRRPEDKREAFRDHQRAAGVRSANARKQRFGTAQPRRPRTESRTGSSAKPRTISEPSNPVPVPPPKGEGVQEGGVGGTVDEEYAPWRATGMATLGATPPLGESP